MAQTPIRVLHITDTLGRGGKERQVYELLKHLSRRDDIRLELVTLHADIVYAGVYALGFPVHVLERRFRQDISVLWRLFRTCRAFRPHLIHTWDSLGAVLAVPVARALKVKLINGMVRNAAPRSDFLRREFRRARLTFPFSDAIVANSRAGLKAYAVPPEKGVCVYNGFDFARLAGLRPREEVKAQWRLTTPYVVGMVANFSAFKDYVTFFRAAQAIARRREDVTFLGVGNWSSPRHSAAYKASRRILDPALGARIRLVPRQEKIESLINVFDVGVLCTNGRIIGEGISNAIMEYMALGKPVVATDGGGTPELVVERETGFMVAAGDVPTLAARIEWLLENRETALRMGDAGKKRIARLFSMERMVADYLRMYAGRFGTHG